MNFRKRKPPLMLMLVLAMLAALAALATLQYRWLGQVSEGERARLKTNLHTGATNFSRDFDRELTRAYRTFQLEAAVWRARDWRKYAARYEQWAASAPYPGLVGGVFLAEEAEDGQLRLLEWEMAAGEFAPRAWPAEFAALRERLAQQSHRVRQTLTGPLQALESQLGVTLRNLPVTPPRDGASVKSVVRFSLGSVAEEIPALVIPMVDHPSDDGKDHAVITPPFAAVVVKLDLAYLQQEFLPTLARQHFASGADFDYHLTIVSRGNPQRRLFQFGPETAAKAETPDATALLGGLRVEDLDRIYIEAWPHFQGVAAARGVKTDRLTIFNFQSATGERAAFSAPLSDEARRWQLQVKHRAGSLEAAVTNARRRNLLTSFGILILLAGSVGLILLATRRAQHLAAQQMEFVSAVSHELRTPLAVIRSAGENLADGVIDDRPQVRRYGALIEREGRRLTEMVEQVLEFAGAQSGRKTYELRPVALPELIAQTLTDCQPQIREGGFQIAAQIPPDLPPVLADAAALRQALHNLLSNAMKYGGEDRWIGLRARTAAGERGTEVRITVSDRGRGIAPADLPHIFEPFYRGREVVAAQIHGNGLGLSLVKRILAAHHGSVSVASEPGRGAAFTLHLPAAPTAGATSHQPSALSYQLRPSGERSKLTMES
jgi:signal transduction histidine kinase